MNNKEKNQHLFELIFNKRTEEAIDILNDTEFNLIKLKNKHTGYNLLHLAIYDLNLFKLINEKNKSLIYDLDYKNESPLFGLIRRNKNIDNYLHLLTKKHLDISNINNENILSIYINKKDYEMVSYCLKKQSILNDYNFYHLNRLNINIPKRFYSDKIKQHYKKFKAGNFSHTYFDALNNLDINSFFNKKSKKIRKLFFQEINKDKENFPHIFLQKALLIKDFDLNIDIVYNYLSNQTKSYGFLNDIEFKIGKDLLSRIKNRVTQNSFLLLIDDLFFTEFKDLEYLSENLSFCEIPKKSKTWEEMRNLIKKSILKNRNERYKDINLNQGIQILNKININEDLYISVPEKQEELIQTSYFLNMCVGNSLHYTDKIKKFESLIILLKEINGDKVKYCIELSTKDFFKIIQAKGNFNEECPMEIQISTQRVIDSIMGRYIPKNKL